jgi:hypothetical protein
VTGPANASELRELQAPIKERYREQPESALISLEAEGTLDEGISCSVNTERYCLVLQTLAGSPELSVSLERR